MPKEPTLAAADSPLRIAVLVSGSGSNLQALLDAIDGDADFGGRVVAVGSDQPGCAGLERARAAGIPTVATSLAEHADRPTWERTLADGVAAHEPDLVVHAGFMRIVSGDYLARWPDAVVNSHPSLLPAFPGAHAVRDALDRGVRVTGVTVHLSVEEVDAGPIIAQRAVDVHDDDTEDSLHARIKAVEHELLPACVKLLCHDRVGVVDGRVAIRAAGSAEALTALDVEGVDA